ncbi:type II secretion system F family protein [Paraburkholderia rhizosphaerae]|uniref:Tight adherence protein B n=1 Tax=Paraburkholderia rhizosphaerae TaxID=480658 RepID=A0A4R8LYA1_9BURK|nr:type II secretion system F family protein [Paraburkholderia rhizosphaerae]TDY51656.1 tight adherence protein B [Paraburkholderia rhizosphaerae]
MNTSFIGFVVLLFIATVLAIEGLYLWWHGKHGAQVKRVNARVRALATPADANAGPGSILKNGGLDDASFTARLLMRLPRAQALQRVLLQAGLDWTIKRFFVYVGACAGGAFGVALVMHQPLFIALVLTALCAPMPWWVVRSKRAKRMKLLEQQLPEAADLVARAMLAGHSFPSALGMVGDEMPQPLGGEFKLAFDEINFGASMSDALQNMVSRVPLDDLRYFVIAVLIQREAGGNLAEILNNISMIIRERLKLLGKVRVLSAEGRLSAWILCLLPFALGGVIMLINPGLMRIFWTDVAGMKLASTALVFMLSGIFWSRKIVRIHV